MSSIPQEARHTRGVDLRSTLTNFRRVHGHVGTFPSHCGETIRVKERRPIMTSCVRAPRRRKPSVVGGSPTAHNQLRVVDSTLRQHYRHVDDNAQPSKEVTSVWGEPKSKTINTRLGRWKFIKMGGSHDLQKNLGPTFSTVYLVSRRSALSPSREIARESTLMAWDEGG